MIHELHLPWRQRIIPGGAIVPHLRAVDLVLPRLGIFVWRPCAISLSSSVFLSRLSKGAVFLAPRRALPCADGHLFQHFPDHKMSTDVYVGQEDRRRVLVPTLSDRCGATSGAAFSGPEERQNPDPGVLPCLQYGWDITNVRQPGGPRRSSHGVWCGWQIELTFSLESLLQIHYSRDSLILSKFSYGRLITSYSHMLSYAHVCSR